MPRVIPTQLQNLQPLPPESTRNCSSNHISLLISQISLELKSGFWTITRPQMGETTQQLHLELMIKLVH